MTRLRLAVSAACLLLVLSGSGCWDREELENLGLVLSLGIDTAPGDRVEVTAQVAIPVKMGGAGGGQGGIGGAEGPITQVVTETASSIPEAFRAINRTVNRRITLAQNRLVVFGEETARQGLARFLALITRYREFRRTMQIMIVRGRAKEIMNLRPKLEKNPAEYLLDLARVSRYTGEADLVNLNDFVKDMERHGGSPHATYLLPPPKKGGETIRIGGVAVFRGDRMVGVYGPPEVIAFLILARRFSANLQGLPDPAVPGRRVVLHLTSAKARITPHLQGDRAAIAIEVKVEADLVGTETGVDYTIGARDRELERTAAGFLQRQLRETVRRAKEEFRTDPFGLGEYFRPLMPTWSDWEAFRWKERFPDVPVSIRVRVYLRRFGFQRQAPTPAR